MTKFEANVAETAAALNVTVRQALILEFANMAAWAHIARNVAAEAVAYAACAHARGEISANDMRACFAIIDQKKAA